MLKYKNRSNRVKYSNLKNGSMQQVKILKVAATLLGMAVLVLVELVHNSADQLIKS